MAATDAPTVNVLRWRRHPRRAAASNLVRPPSSPLLETPARQAEEGPEVRSGIPPPGRRQVSTSPLAGLCVNQYPGAGCARPLPHTSACPSFKPGGGEVGPNDRPSGPADGDIGTWGGRRGNRPPRGHSRSATNAPRKRGASSARRTSASEKSARRAAEAKAHVLPRAARGCPEGLSGGRGQPREQRQGTGGAEAPREARPDPDQVASGELKIRKMTPAERKKHPPKPRPVSKPAALVVAQIVRTFAARGPFASLSASN